ncbi:MAG: DUF4975 domain-containing protein [Oscillospiraceae bacterium]|nr:DUF4975 domain-containing protein [Oscillospiraceae bacterium]
MRKTVCILLALMLLLCGCGSPGDTTDPQTASEYPEVPVFPKSDAFVGDTMPFFDGGKMNIFYLADQRDGKTGYHPWGLLRTEDYCSYEDMGIVLPYGNDATDQDIALGTGCVIKDQSGVYHAFYTGHNDFYSPKEAIMHATSSDMLSWTKVPEDTFIAGPDYSLDDFRDPYVFYVEEEQCWWMLVVTRAGGTGVIVRYTSKDLSKWEDQGVFFTDDMGYGTNMECPTLLKFGGTWYLSFSDQWPDRVVHYRVSDSIHGPFKSLEKDTVDSNGFYAGRLETDGEHLYLVGWNGTKVGHEDPNDYDWAGNAVIHQLKQEADGSLKPIPNEQVAAKLSHPQPLNPLRITETIKADKGSYQMAGNQYELVQFDTLDQSTRIDAVISGYGAEARFGFAFAPDADNVGSMSYVFNVPEGRVEFYNQENLVEEEPQSWMDFDFSAGEPLRVTIFAADGVASLYLNDQLALTARMYRSQGTRWQIFSMNSPVTWESIGIYQ